MLEEKLKELAELDKKPAPGETPPSDPYAFETAGKGVPEVAAAETAEDFSRETSATREAEFESKPRPELHEETFPWQESEYGYRPPVRPVTPAPGPERIDHSSYRRDIVAMLQGTESLRTAIVISTVLGPPRSKRPFHPSWGSER